MPLKFYLISKGECEVWVNDEKRVETFVRLLRVGEYFGEVALMTQQRRTATVITKSYSNIGSISRETFDEMLIVFPDLQKYLK